MLTSTTAKPAILVSGGLPLVDVGIAVLAPKEIRAAVVVHHDTRGVFLARVTLVTRDVVAVLVAFVQLVVHIQYLTLFVREVNRFVCKLHPMLCMGFCSFLRW